jgi:hypothetical protein
VFLNKIVLESYIIQKHKMSVYFSRILNLYNIMTTEQDLIEMSKHFRDEIKKKNNKISSLQKYICLIYGLVRTMDESEDVSFVQLIRDYSSQALTELCGVEEFEEENE